MLVRTTPFSFPVSRQIQTPVGPPIRADSLGTVEQRFLQYQNIPNPYYAQETEADLLPITQEHHQRPNARLESHPHPRRNPHLPPPFMSRDASFSSHSNADGAGGEPAFSAAPYGSVLPPPPPPPPQFQHGVIKPDPLGPASLASYQPTPAFSNSFDDDDTTPKRRRVQKRQNSDSYIDEDDDYEGDSDEEEDAAGDGPDSKNAIPFRDPLVPIKGHFIEVKNGPGRHQVKDFNVLPINILRVVYDARDEDYVLIRLHCDDRMKLRDSRIFVHAVSAKHNIDNDGEIVLQNLKISKDMLHGRTKGFHFMLTYTLIAGGREAETIASHPFYIWSNVKQQGFPRGERDKYLEARKQINRGKRKR